MADKKINSYINKISLQEEKQQLQSLISESVKDLLGLNRNYKIDFTDKCYSINNILKEGFSTKVKALSFFSGAGGLDIGSTLAGVEVISSMDFDRDSVKTLKSNPLFHQAKVSHSDICQETGKDYKSILDKFNPEKLILIGGPPCQPFSKAGYWIGNKSRLGINDPRNMIGEYFRLIDEIKPDGFLLENVESLLHPTNRIAVEFITNKIIDLGYHFTMIRANAIDYGVPQKRKRVFFVASKNRLKTAEPIKSHGSEEARLINPNLMPYERVIDWIGKFDKPDFFEREEVTNKGTYHFELTEVPPGKNYISLTAVAGYPNPKFEAQKRFWSFLLKLHPELPSWTVAAQPGPWVGPFHWNSRRLRVPEISAIQTFPEDYNFEGSRRSIQKQIGNAVPPLLGKAMVNFLIQNL